MEITHVRSIKNCVQPHTLSQNQYNILSNCNLNYQHANVLVRVIYCVVPENVHTPPTEGIGNSGGVGVLKGPNM